MASLHFLIVAGYVFDICVPFYTSGMKVKAVARDTQELSSCGRRSRSETRPADGTAGRIKPLNLEKHCQPSVRLSHGRGGAARLAATHIHDS